VRSPRWRSDGKLLTAGLNVADFFSGAVPQLNAFRLDTFVSCPSPFSVLAIDPQTMRGEVVATGPANKDFSNITMRLPIDDVLWIWSFCRDRVGYMSLKHTDSLL